MSGYTEEREKYARTLLSDMALENGQIVDCVLGYLEFIRDVAEDKLARNEQGFRAVTEALLAGGGKKKLREELDKQRMIYEKDIRQINRMFELIEGMKDEEEEDENQRMD